MMRTQHAAIFVISLCGCIGACGREGSSPAAGIAAPQFKKAPRAVRKGPSADEQTAGMAAAPSLAKSTLPADLKFELGERPKLGQSLEINLALLPKVDGGPVTLQVSGAEGVDTAPDEGNFEIAAVEAGEVYRHTVHVTPTSDGVQLVNLKVVLLHDDVSDSQVFTVPVIVDR